MKSYFKIVDGVLVASSTGAGDVCFFTFPHELEKQEILKTLNIDRYDLDSAFDKDEISRIEFTQDRVFVIWKNPTKISVGQELRFGVSSTAFFLQKNTLTMIIAADLSPFSSKEFQNVNSLIDVILKYFFYTIRQYLSQLKTINQTTAELQSKISSSMENRYLLQMFDISESLIYYQNAIEANGAVLSKLRSNTEKQGFSKQQTDLLEDIILENAQCARQAQIYSTVLSGLMDARGTIINNNMNVLLKTLAIINIVFLPLNLVASIGGMSEYTLIMQELGVDWKLSYLLFILVLIPIAWLTMVILNKYIGNGKK